MASEKSKAVTVAAARVAAAVAVSAAVLLAPKAPRAAAVSG